MPNVSFAKFQNKLMSTIPNIEKIEDRFFIQKDSSSRGSLFFQFSTAENLKISGNNAAYYSLTNFIDQDIVTISNSNILDLKDKVNGTNTVITDIVPYTLISDGQCIGIVIEPVGITQTKIKVIYYPAGVEWNDYF